MTSAAVSCYLSACVLNLVAMFYSLFGQRSLVVFRVFVGLQECSFYSLKSFEV